MGLARLQHYLGQTRTLRLPKLHFKSVFSSPQKVSGHRADAEHSDQEHDLNSDSLNSNPTSITCQKRQVS